MLRRATQWLFLAVLATLAPAPARAYDLIFADSIDVVSPPSVSGFSYGNEIAMIVNTGPANIGNPEFSGATFTATTTDPLVDAYPSILNTGLVTPILPNEAVGTLLGSGSPLLDRVLPGETVRNVFPVGLFWLGVNYPPGYEGTVVIYTTMTMGIDVLQYYTVLVIQPGSQYSIAVAHASRGTSIPQPTAAKSSTWGAVKKLYH